MSIPNLVEPGTRFFLRQTLKTCHMRNLNFYNKLYNVILLLFFVTIVGTFLYYKKTHRLTKEEIIKQKKENNIYFIEKLKTYNDSVLKQSQSQSQSQSLITNLPMYKSEFR